MDLEYYKNLIEEIKGKLAKKESLLSGTIFFVLLLFSILFVISRYDFTKSGGAYIILALFFSFYISIIVCELSLDWILKFSTSYTKLSKELETNKNIVEKIEDDIEKEEGEIREKINKKGLKKIQELENIYKVLYNKRISEEYTNEYSRFLEITSDLSNNEYYFDNYTKYHDLQSLQKYANSLKERITNYSLKSKTNTFKKRNTIKNTTKNNLTIKDEVDKIKLITIEDFETPNKQGGIHISNKDWRTDRKIKIDFLKKNKQNIELGLRGELIILEWEKENLIDHGLKDLAKKVKHVSQEIGDGAGFDILSYDFNGDERFIEVKTTKQKPVSKFYFSENELTFINNHQNYYLYRLCLRDEEEAKLTIINKNDFFEKFQITPHQYIVKIKK